MSNKKLQFVVGQYVLLPVSYNSLGEVSIDTPFVEEATNQKGNSRLILRAYYNSNFLGSPVFRRTDETITKGMRIFIPKVDTGWTVVQIKSVSEKAAYGKPVNLEVGLLTSYAIKCRELYYNSLTYDKENITIKSKNLELPSFEEWMVNKEDYISTYKRDKEVSSGAIIKNLKTEIKELKEKIKTLTDRHAKNKATIRKKTEVLESDIRALKIKDSEVLDDLTKLFAAIDNFRGEK